MLRGAGIETTEWSTVALGPWGPGAPGPRCAGSSRWSHDLVCRLLLVVIAFAVVVGTMEIGPAAEEMALIGFGLTIASAGLLWAPYLFVKRSVPRGDLAGGVGTR